jgi:hypothetical protein
LDPLGPFGAITIGKIPSNFLFKMKNSSALFQHIVIPDLDLTESNSNLVNEDFWVVGVIDGQIVGNQAGGSIIPLFNSNFGSESSMVSFSPCQGVFMVELN